MQSDTDQSCWGYPGPFPMSFANSPKRTRRPLAMTLPVLSAPGAEISREHLVVRACVVSGCVRPSSSVAPSRTALRRADDRLSDGWSRPRPTDEVGQVVLHGSLGSNPKTPAARTPVVRVLPRARCRQGSGNLRSRRATSRRRQQVLARPFPVALQAVSRQYEAVFRDARFPSRYWPRWMAFGPAPPRL